MDYLKLKLNPKNPRTISEEAFSRLKKKIERNPDGLEVHRIGHKDGIIISGNQRFRAIKELGLKPKDEWFQDLTGWTKEQIKEWVVTSNINDGEHDFEVLSNEYDVEELEAYGLEVPGANGATEVEEDEPPEVSQDPPKSKLGEIYQLGNHRVMCGDSTDKENVELLMDGVTIEAVLSDPPYGMDLDTDFSNMTSDNSFASGKKHSKVIGDSEQFDATYINGLAKEVILFGADYYVDTLPNFGKDGSWMIWDKRSSESQDKGFGSNFETIWSKTRHKRWILRHEWFGFFTGGEKREYEHPTTKPVKLLVDVLAKINVGDNIIDLFLGSGSTLIAREQTDRICYGMELDPKYVDVIRKRYWKFVNGSEDGWEEGTPCI